MFQPFLFYRPWRSYPDDFVVAPFQINENGRVDTGLFRPSTKLMDSPINFVALCARVYPNNGVRHCTERDEGGASIGVAIWNSHFV